MIIMLSQNVYASEINLSSLSGGNEYSHNCILEDKFDIDYHWQECKMCKQAFNKTNHTLETKYTISANSCSPSNYKIISCSLCDYSTQEPVNKKHTLKSIHHGISSDTGLNFIYSKCSVCTNNYYHSYDGYKYTYSDGTEVDPGNLRLSTTIKNPDGASGNITWKYQCYELDDSMFDITYSISNSKTFNATVKIKVPDLVINWIGKDNIASSSNVWTNLWGYNLFDGFEGGNTSLSPTNIFYNKTSNIYTVKFTGNLKDYTKNYDTIGNFNVVLYVKKDSTLRAAYKASNTPLPVNFIDPLITNVE